MSGLPSERYADGSARPLLEVENLKKHFPVYKGVFSRVSGHVYAVDGVSFHINRGETLAWSARAAAASQRWDARC
jgi:ABC-type glutathione transport system ATPase component